MARRKTTTARVSSAARHNLVKAQVSRVRSQEPRQVGRIRPPRKPLTRA